VDVIRVKVVGERKVEVGIRRMVFAGRKVVQLIGVDLSKMFGHMCIHGLVDWM
jgi:hypothetical protein